MASSFCLDLLVANQRYHLAYIYSETFFTHGLKDGVDLKITFRRGADIYNMDLWSEHGIAEKRWNFMCLCRCTGGSSVRSTMEDSPWSELIRTNCFRTNKSLDQMQL